MQAAQNTSQVFLGVNLKCASCHDSFVNKWKLKDAYGLAAYFSPEPTLQMFRCDLPQDKQHRPGLPLPGPRAHAAIAARSPIAAPPRPRSSPTRAWAGCRARSSTASGSACWAAASSPPSTRWTASRGARRCSTGWPPTSSAHDYDVKHLIETIVTSRAYQMPAVRREAEPPARGYVFRGPEVRRLTAEQFADAVGSITGEWSVAPVPPAPAAAAGVERRRRTAAPPPSQPTRPASRRASGGRRRRR